MELTSEFLFLVPLIVGFVQVVKTTVPMDSKFAPALSLILGVAGAYFFVSNDLNGVLQGLVAGLSASGLWSGTKKVLE